MTQHKMTKIFNKEGGCDEDCFNCKYPDCYKNAKDILADEERNEKK